MENYDNTYHHYLHRKAIICPKQGKQSSFIVDISNRYLDFFHDLSSAIDRREGLGISGNTMHYSMSSDDGRLFMMELSHLLGFVTTVLHERLAIHGLELAGTECRNRGKEVVVEWTLQPKKNSLHK